MRVKVIFITPMMKSGILRNPGDEMEIDATAAALLAAKDCVTIPGYDVKRVTKEIEVDVLVPKEEAAE